MPTPPAHAPFGPSAGDRWIRCPRSFYLHKQEPFSSIYADEGTVAHWIGEQCLAGLLDEGPCKQPGDYVDEVIDKNYHPDLKKLDHKILITQDMVDNIQEYVDHVIFIVSQIPLEHLIFKLELKVKLTEDCWGTADCVIINKMTRELFIIDLKFGRGVSVQAENNYQLLIYAAATLTKIDPLASWYPLIVHMQIFQPRIMGEGSLRTSEMPFDLVHEWASMYAAKAIREIKANKDTPENLALEPGEKQCRWCSFGKRCKASAKVAFDQAGLEFAEFAVKTDSALPQAEELSDQEVANIITGLPLLKHWMKVIADEGLHRMKQGKTIPGYKAVRGTKFRKYADAKIAEAILFDAIGNDAYKKTVLTPAQGEKKLGKKHSQYQAFQDNIFKPEGEAQLVPDSNKKPAMNLAMGAEFAEYVQET